MGGISRCGQHPDTHGNFFVSRPDKEKSQQAKQDGKSQAVAGAVMKRSQISSQNPGQKVEIGEDAAEERNCEHGLCARLPPRSG
jgi:hypothetical protein